MSERRHNTKPYPEAFRRDAVALVHSSGRPIREIAVELGVSSESLRLWCKRAEIDAGFRLQSGRSPARRRTFQPGGQCVPQPLSGPGSSDLR